MRGLLVLMAVLLAASFDMGITVDAMFFIGNQLVAISRTGKVVVWHAMTEHWQVCKCT